MREGLQWKAHSHEVRVARTWNGKPDPPAGGARPKKQNGLRNSLPQIKKDKLLSGAVYLLIKKLCNSLKI